MIKDFIRRIIYGYRFSSEDYVQHIQKSGG